MNGQNKKNRRRIKSLEDRIEEHEEKIAEEKARYYPDAGLVRYWEKEINGWKKDIERRRKRLPGGK